MPPYNDALKKSGFKENLVYTPKTTTRDILGKNQRKRKRFFKFAKETFSKKKKLHKIFIKNNVKIIYSCMSNISSILAGRNKLLLQPEITKYGCNCRVKYPCPLQNQYQIANLIYRSDIDQR